MAAKKLTMVSAAAPAAVLPAGGTTPRSIGSACISFGLVSVPVKLHTAAATHDLAWHQLHDKDSGRAKQRLVCSTCGEDLTATNIVKGYEHAKGQCVVFTKEELKALEESTDNSIEILDFVPLASVDPVFFEKSTMLAPDKGASKAYKLLTAGMKAAGRGAVAKFSTKGRDKLVLLRTVTTTFGDGLMLHALYYSDEVRSFEGLDLGQGATVSDGELDLALRLIEELAADSFKPATYTDAYRAKVLSVVEQKAAGGAVTMPTAAAPKAAVIDMMAALKASLGKRAKKAA